MRGSSRPLLFLIFINDLPSSTTLFTLLFAGDTIFQISSNNLTDLYKIANGEIKKASVWFKANKLTLNISKTKYMIFRTKNMNVDFENVALKLDGTNIERIGEDCETKYFKFVGLHLDEYLSWQYQINHVQSKLSSGNYAIAQSKNFLPIKI